MEFLRTWLGLIADQRFKLQLILIGAQFLHSLALEVGSWIIQEAVTGGKIIHQRRHHIGSAHLLQQDRHQDQEQQNPQGDEGGVAPPPKSRHHPGLGIGVELPPHLLDDPDQAARQHLGAATEAGKLGPAGVITGHHRFDQLKLAQFLAGKFEAKRFHRVQRLLADLRGRPEASQQLGLHGLGHRKFQFRAYGPVVVMLQLNALDLQGSLVAPLQIAAQVAGIRFAESSDPIGETHGFRVGVGIRESAGKDPPGEHRNHGTHH